MMWVVDWEIVVIVSYSAMVLRCKSINGGVHNQLCEETKIDEETVCV